MSTNLFYAQIYDALGSILLIKFLNPVTKNYILPTQKCPKNNSITTDKRTQSCAYIYMLHIFVYISYDDESIYTANLILSSNRLENDM